jgi:hypothetical protein
VKKWESELAQIARENGGVLQARAVVEFARDESTALHQKFTWDDAAAADEYRLLQARNLIAVAVTVLPGVNTEVRAYVSMYDDRKIPGGGYRTIDSVMSSSISRARFMDQAKQEFGVWQKKYESLSELETVFSAMERVGKTKRRPVDRRGKTCQLVKSA